MQSQDVGRIWWSPLGEALPPLNRWAIISRCVEWDGLFALEAVGERGRLVVTAWCDDGALGDFRIEKDGRTVASGTTRVSSAPALVKDDGSALPSGAHFTAGRWELSCTATDGIPYLIVAEIRDWGSID
jgi:hypothetical protein